MMDLTPYAAWMDKKKTWGIFDKDGFVTGIRPDAPDDVQKAYKAMKAEREAARKEGILL